MKKSMCLVVVLLSILSNPASGQWLKTDTVTSGDYDDHSPRIDHNGGAWTSSGPAAGEWMVFQRDSAHLSSIAGKRFWFQKQKWDTAVSQISPAINGVEQTSPDVCGLVKGYDSLIVLAAWLREEDGFKRIYFSTTVGDSTAWSVPQRLNDDTVKDASLKLGPNGNSVFVTWKCGNVVMYSLFYQDSISRADTLVISNFDSVEYDLEAYSIAWTFRDSASGHICLAHGSITLGLPSHISYIDTIRSSGDIRNPSLTGEQYFFPTYEVQAGDRIEVHTMGLSGPPAQFTDSTLFSAPGVNALDPAAFSLGYDNYWIWEQQTVSGTSIVFTLSGSYRTTVSDTFIGGRNPVMGSNAQQVRNYPLNTFANVAIWEYPINGESKIYGRVFLPDRKSVV